jgi:hypothetical protein
VPSRADLEGFSRGAGVLSQTVIARRSPTRDIAWRRALSIGLGGGGAQIWEILCARPMVGRLNQCSVTSVEGGPLMRPTQLEVAR